MKQEVQAEPQTRSEEATLEDMPEPRKPGKTVRPAAGKPDDEPSTQSFWLNDAEAPSSGCNEATLTWRCLREIKSEPIHYDLHLIDSTCLCTLNYLARESRLISINTNVSLLWVQVFINPPSFSLVDFYGGRFGFCLVLEMCWRRCVVWEGILSTLMFCGKWWQVKSERA